jgi:cytochrome c2
MAAQQRRWNARVCKKKVAELPDSKPLHKNVAATNKSGKITGHWGEDAVGFRWTEQDSVDDRLSRMDVGRFYSATIATPQEMTLKGIAVRVGEKSEAAVLFDTELLRVVCGWPVGEGKNFLEFNPARYGIIGPPKPNGPIAFHSPRQPGWSRDGEFRDPRPKPFGPLPREWAKYRGLHLHGDRVVFEYTVGSKQVVVLESPWIEAIGEEKVFSRELEIAPSDTELELLIAVAGTPVNLVCEPNVATLDRRDGRPITAKVAKHDQSVRLKVLLPLSANSAPLVFQKPDSEIPRSQRTRSEDHEKLSLRRFVKPGPARWTAEITTRGVVSDKHDALVVDTLTLPFDNPHKALMFVGGHDFFVSGTALAAGAKITQLADSPAASAVPLSQRFDAAICTLHGDVWLVSGIDHKLEKLTWKRFATGLFQPLGLKIVKNQIYVVGRDQITRLHDLNGDGEADWYENFNNDGQVTANGHEYVACLEVDSQGWFYYLKGNANGATDHDGCLLRVSPDGQKLEVVATGFRNANGMSIRRFADLVPEVSPPGTVYNILYEGDVITVAPQEGEWTPGSAIFQVHPGGFYGYTPSAHRAKPPTQFSAPLCWIPRLQDNSCGGQVWVPDDVWGKLAKRPLHLSYGTSQMFLLLRGSAIRNWEAKSIAGGGLSVLPEENQKDDHVIWSGATVPLSLPFESGVMRGRFRRSEEQLYVSGLRGWVSNAAKDGCFQRVRYTGRPLNVPLSVSAYENGLLLAFSDPLDPKEAEDPENFRVQRWNYRWSAAYGSPEFKVSNPSQEGRDELEVVSATRKPEYTDQNALFLEIPNMQPSHQLSLTMTLKTADGQSIERRIDATVNAVRRGIVEVPNRPPRARLGQLAEAEVERLVPGICCEYVGHVSNVPGQEKGHVETVPHVRRMVAWRFEPHEINGAREIVATGYLIAPRRGTYRISAESNSATEVSIGDEVVWRTAADKPAEVQLLRGYNRLRVVQRVDADRIGQAVSLRLLWSSDAFETEPIPPTSLFCEPLSEETRSLQHGRELFAQHQCVRCHRIADEVFSSRTAMPELKSEAPDLIGVGSRLRGDWIADWVLNPSKMRSDAHMPRLFPFNPTAEHRQQAADLAAYLSNLTLASGERQPPGLSDGQSTSKTTGGKSAPVRPESGVLWEDLGCIGCHRLTTPGEDASFFSGRTRLDFVRDKFLSGELAQYLRQPQRHYPWTRMPDFGLSEKEADSLASMLTQSIGNVSPNEIVRPHGDAARGEKLFVSLGCRQCHRVSADLPLPKPHLPSVFGKRVGRGCLAESEQPRAAGVPDFQFNPAEQSALLALFRSDERRLANDSPTEVSRRFVSELQCAVCHPRDGRLSSLPEILSEESERGGVIESAPNLTWVGEKLHSPWMNSLLEGRLTERTRPWMKLRMPNFPARAHLLADGLAREHGLSSDPSPRPNVDHDLVAIGEVLATRAGTLDCRQCHSIGRLLPTGDKSTLLAPGINFALTRERIRHDFYRRFTLDPPRYEVSTRMPKLVLDGRTTKVKDILDGDARQQFDAVWHYLQTVPSSMADP